MVSDSRPTPLNKSLLNLLLKKKLKEIFSLDNKGERLSRL